MKAAWTARPAAPLAVILGALALRLVNLGGRIIWYDEAIAVLYSEKPLDRMLSGIVTQVDGAAANVHPLFYFGLLHGWLRFFGSSPLAVRLLSVLLGTATVALLYLLARRLLGPRAALATAVIAAVAPFHIYYSQETRMYALLGFCAVAATYFFVRAWAGGQRRDWLLYGVAAAATVYAHNLGAFFILAIGLWILGQWLRARRLLQLMPVVAAHVLALLIYLPWLLVIPSQVGKIQQSYWVARPGLVNLIQTSFIIHFAYDNQALPDGLIAPVLFFSLLLPVLLLVEWRRYRRDPAAFAGPFSGAFSLLATLTVVPILGVFVVSQWLPVYIVRGFLPSALMYYTLLGGLFVAGPAPRLIKTAVLTPAALVVALSLFNHYAYDGFPRPPFPEANAYLRDHAAPGEAIVHANKFSYISAHYYDRELPAVFVADAPGAPDDTLGLATQATLGLFALPDIAAATDGHDRLWYVAFNEDEPDPANAPPRTGRQRWLADRYALVTAVRFGTLTVYEYEAINR